MCLDAACGLSTFLIKDKHMAQPYKTSLGNISNQIFMKKGIRGDSKVIAVLLYMVDTIHQHKNSV